MSEPHPPSIHRIRLKGPWEWAVPTPSPQQAWTWNRIRLPDEWDRLPTMTGPVWFRRRFHAPTGITPLDRVRVVISTVQPLSSVHLNGQPLPRMPLLGHEPDSVICFELTQHMTERNLLEIFFGEGITAPHIDGGLGHPVTLEIVSFPTVMEA